MADGSSGRQPLMSWDFDNLLSEDDAGMRVERPLLREDTERNREFRRLWRSPAENVYQMVVSSSIVRALQDKTQMIPLDSSANARTRLTHSLEVSSVASRLLSAVRALVEEGSDTLADGRRPRDYFDLDDAQFDAARWTLMTAGLVHDLGNPPFGHPGEDCLRQEIRLVCERLAGSLGPGKAMSARETADLAMVEGNAQALRYLIHPNGAMMGALGHSLVSGDGRAAQPTYVLLAAITKYTVCSADWGDATDRAGGRGAFVSSPLVWRHKPGCYLTEAEHMAQASRQLGLVRSDSSPFEYCRHPLAYLLEAADDIAYLTADFEDAYAKGYATDDDVRRIVGGLREKVPLLTSSVNDVVPLDQRLAELGPGAETFSQRYAVVDEYVVYRLREAFIYAAARQFVRNLPRIMRGEYTGELLNDAGGVGAIAQALRTFMRTEVYENPEIVARKDRGLAALRQVFRRLAGCMDGETGRLACEGRTIPRTFVDFAAGAPYGGGFSDAYVSLRTILDYVSSLTDWRLLEIAEAYETLG